MSGGKAGAVDDAAANLADLGHWLRELRHRQGLSQEQVALKAGIAVFTYARIERGRSPNPTMRTSLNIVRALRIRPEDLALFGVIFVDMAQLVSDISP